MEIFLSERKGDLRASDNAIRSLKTVMGTKHIAFNGSGMQDATEFFGLLLSEVRDSLEVGGGHGLVVVPDPAAHVVPEDVRHVVTRGGRGAVVTDYALQLVAVLLRPSTWLVLHAVVRGAGELFIVVVDVD